MQEWRICSKRADFTAIGREFKIDPVISRIIRNRDVEDIDSIREYLEGDISHIADAMSMKDMDKAVSIMEDAIAHKKKIRIIGDYDIDGICSIYILFKGLLRLGADVDYDVPDRIADGYGINEKLIEKAHDEGRNVIITCDNGIAAINQIAHAKALGMTVIVTDHHDVQYEQVEEKKIYKYPPADALVDPKQPDCQYPFKMLCGAGIAYRYICLLYKRRNIPEEETKELLSFAAFATVGDIVDLKGENRIIVKEGIKILRHSNNMGLNELIKVTGVEKENISAYHIGFVLGPCFNASGRLDTAKKALQMLLSDDAVTAGKYAIELNNLNEQRKDLTSKAVDEAVEIVENSSLKDDRVLVIYIPNCHESIAGIVAGKVREKYYKPVIVLTDGIEGVKGSARSIESYNIFEKLMECSDLLSRFGGHPMAAGLSLTKENIESLRKKLNERCNLSQEDLTEKIWIDVPMPISYITESLINQLSLLEPFGKANEKPVFAAKNLKIKHIKAIGKQAQFTKMILEDATGFFVDAIGFFDGGQLMEAQSMKKLISCIYYPQINEYNGKKSIQICITSYRIEQEIAK